MFDLAIRIFTGIVGSTWNLGFALGEEILHRSLDLGANPSTSTYSLWALILTVGFILNPLYGR